MPRRSTSLKRTIVHEQITLKMWQSNAKRWKINGHLDMPEIPVVLGSIESPYVALCSEFDNFCYLHFPFERNVQATDFILIRTMYWLVISSLWGLSSLSSWSVRAKSFRTRPWLTSLAIKSPGLCLVQKVTLSWCSLRNVGLAVRKTLVQRNFLSICHVIQNLHI